MELTRDEERALAGEEGEAIQTAYRILVATGEATDAERLVPVQWAHISGVNYNTIGDAGASFLKEISADARVKIRASLNPMGYDVDSISKYGLDDEFLKNQEEIRESYVKMGVTPSFSCIPYEIFDEPPGRSQVAFAESNAAIYANSMTEMRTNKESAFSALASALTGKSPYTEMRGDAAPEVTIRNTAGQLDELGYGLLGFFAGKQDASSVGITGTGSPDMRSCKSMCASMGTSGTCARFVLGGEGAERVEFGKKEMQGVRDELDTAEHGDIITLGSPQLGAGEIASLAAMLRGRSFKKRCLVFCPRTVKEQAQRAGQTAELERAGCEILSDCCTCLTPLINSDEIDAVTTNSIKGAYYMKNSNGVGINLKPLSEIVRDETA